MECKYFPKPFLTIVRVSLKLAFMTRVQKYTATADRQHFFSLWSYSAHRKMFETKDVDFYEVSHIHFCIMKRFLQKINKFRFELRVKYELNLIDMYKN
jgi:hypothetical protein